MLLRHTGMGTMPILHGVPSSPLTTNIHALPLYRADCDASYKAATVITTPSGASRTTKLPPAGTFAAVRHDEQPSKSLTPPCRSFGAAIAFSTEPLYYVDQLSAISLAIAELYA